MLDVSVMHSDLHKYMNKVTSSWSFAKEIMTADIEGGELRSHQGGTWLNWVLV